MYSMAKYTVDCFTPTSAGSRHPENTYEVDTLDDVSKVVANCTVEIAGIRMVQVWINEPGPVREPVAPEVSEGYDDAPLG